MRLVFLLLLACGFIYADGVCPLTEVGTSIYGGNGKGYIDWHGWLPGTSTSQHRQVITSWAKHPQSDTWLTTNEATTTGTVMNNGQIQSDGFGDPWRSQDIHYVHGNTQRRIPFKITATPPYTPDPGTVPIPPKPRIANYYGPNSRPRGATGAPYFLDPAYLLQHYTGPADQQLHVIDIDNCFEYDYWSCDDNGSSIVCQNGGVYDLLAGDWQRPFATANVSNTSAVSGIQQMVGRFSWDEWISPGGIKHAINVTMMNGGGALVAAFTGPATLGQYEAGGWHSARLPFGSRIRLKASFDPAANGIPSECQPLVDVLKTYGAFFVDGGLTANAATQENAPFWSLTCPVLASGALLFNHNNAEVVVQPAPFNKIYCAYGFSGCPDTLPTGNPPVISSFTINGGSSATVALTGSKQALLLAWSVSGVVDADGNPVRLRFISWGPNNSFGPGAVDGPTHGERVNMTVCASNACDIQNRGTYPIQFMVQNRFGRSTAYVNLTVQ